MKPYLCPLCLGRGMDPFFGQQVGQTASASPPPCPACKGARILWGFDYQAIHVEPLHPYPLPQYPALPWTLWPQTICDQGTGNDLRFQTTGGIYS